MSARTSHSRAARRRLGRHHVSRPATSESYAPGADYIPSGTADMWRCAKPRYRH
jgi:hypothetical protein